MLFLLIHDLLVQAKRIVSTSPQKLDIYILCLLGYPLLFNIRKSANSKPALIYDLMSGHLLLFKVSHVLLNA